MSDFAISNHIPVPVKRVAATRQGRKARYPFEALEVGQSFFVPNACLNKSARKEGQIIFSPCLRASVIWIGSLCAARWMKATTAL